MIEIKHLKKSFGNLSVLKDVNASIRKGEIISIIGPSGTGKSTLLRCLNLLERPDSGEVCFDGLNLLAPHVDIPSIRRKMGMVFQQFNLFPHLTVLENITVSPRKLLKQSKAEAKNNAMNLLKLVGLENKVYALPAQLSGGQQQRVAIARTLAMKPEVILFDEPTSALDPTMVDEVLDVITHLAETGITMIIVTHEMRFARNISSRIFYMDDGIIYEDGTPDEIFTNPKKPKTIAFIKRVDMEYFHLRKNDFDSGHLCGRMSAFAKRHLLKNEESEQFRDSVLTLLEDIIFPLSEDVDLRLGFSKETKSFGFSVIWNGAVSDPFARITLPPKLHDFFPDIKFDTDVSGRPRLRFVSGGLIPGKQSHLFF